MLVQTYEQQNAEVKKLRDRLAAVSPLTAKQDARIEELFNNLSEARHSIEDLRSENQQLKIEKEVWRTSENRTMKESQELLRERNSANDRLRDIQKHSEDREKHFETKLQKVEQRFEDISRDLYCEFNTDS